MYHSILQQFDSSISNSTQWLSPLTHIHVYLEPSKDILIYIYFSPLLTYLGVIRKEVDLQSSVTHEQHNGTSSSKPRSEEWQTGEFISLSGCYMGTSLQLVDRKLITSVVMSKQFRTTNNNPLTDVG